ncbi:MAG: B12-binding domain-containing radical SAM protein [Thermodesulfobacteriota bacterium]
MRVLLVNPQMPESFWSLRQSCILSGRKTLLPPLGLLTVAALLPPEWELRLADLNTRALTSEDWQWTDLVMATGMIIQQQGVLNLIREAKERRKIVVAGGPYVTGFPQEALEAGTDFLVQGEGETTIPRLLAALREKKPGEVITEDGKPEMTISPVPRFDLLNFDDYLTMGIQTSRGCPFDCEFCDIVSLYGRKPRYKNPHQVIAELETLYRLGWRRDVFISDDNFIGNQDHARSILNYLIPWMQDHGEPFGFWTQTSVNLGQNREMIDLMTAANFSHVFVGAETPEPEILQSVGKHQNLRNPLSQSLATINANGLSMIVSFIIGFDGEKSGAMDRIVEFVEKLGTPIVMINILQPLPNTKLWKRLEDEGRLLQGKTSGDSYGFILNFIPSRPQAEILEEYVRGIDRLYEPSRYLARAYQYFLNMRPTRRALAKQAGENGAAAPKNSKTPPARKSAGSELALLLRMIWEQGIRPNYRGQFWRQLWGIYRHNPSRLKGYLLTCFMGLDLFALRLEILERWGSAKSPAGCDRKPISAN